MKMPHDAFSDVLATIYLLKIIKEKSCNFDYVFSLRSKHEWLVLFKFENR